MVQKGSMPECTIARGIQQGCAATPLSRWRWTGKWHILYVQRTACVQRKGLDIRCIGGKLGSYLEIMTLQMNRP